LDYSLLETDPVVRVLQIMLEHCEDFQIDEGTCKNHSICLEDYESEKDLSFESYNDRKFGKVIVDLAIHCDLTQDLHLFFFSPCAKHLMIHQPIPKSVHPGVH
jgi:hypothetical protein